MDDLKNILKERHSRLPEGLKSYISSSGWKDALKTVAWKYNVSLDDSETIKTEIVFVLFGLQSYKDFKQSLYSQNLSMPKEALDNIADELDALIFSRVRAFLDEIDKKEESVNKEAVQKEMQIEIEHPQKTPSAFEKTFSVPQSANIIEDKLGKVVKLPHEKSEQTAETAPKPFSHYGDIDPYREPIE